MDSKGETDKIEEEKRIKEAKEEEEIRRHKKTLLIFFGIIGIMVFGFLTTWYLINASKHFTYMGVDFTTDDSAKGLTLFKATMVGQVTKAKYNFYFRNEPSKLITNVPVTGALIFRKNIVFDSTADEFNCEGQGVLAISQFSNGMSSFGVKLLKQNISMRYTPAEDYMFLTFVKGNATEIKQISDFGNAYEVVINNCEILPAMERMMLEAVVRAGAKK